MPAGDRPDARRKPVAFHLASGRTVGQTAKMIGVDPSTIQRWKAEPAFQDRVHALRSEMFSVAVGRIASIAGMAVSELKKLLKAEVDPIV